MLISGGGMNGGGGAAIFGGGGTTSGGGGGFLMISSITLTSIGPFTTSTTCARKPGDQRIDDDDVQQHDRGDACRVPGRVALLLCVIHVTPPAKVQ